MSKRVKGPDGITHIFPDDATDDEIRQAFGGDQRQKPDRAQEVTRLGASDEAKFQQWVKTNKITDVDDPRSFYDYRGYWKDIASKGGDQRKSYADGPHFPDTYKQHGHPTFSEESKYSTGKGDGGRWNGETYIPESDQYRGPDTFAGGVKASLKDTATQVGHKALDALPAIGGIVGGVLSTPETLGTGTIGGIALGVGGGRALRDLIAEGLGLEAPTSAASKGARVALDTAEAAAAQAVLPGVIEAIRTPGRTVREVYDVVNKVLPAKLRLSIPPGMANTSAKILERPAWQSWQEYLPQAESGTAPAMAPTRGPAAPVSSPQTAPLLEKVTASVAAPAEAPMVTSGQALKTGLDTSRAANIKLTSEEVRQATKWIKDGVKPEQVMQRILLSRELTQRLGLPTPDAVQADAFFPKGQRGSMQRFPRVPPK